MKRNSLSFITLFLAALAFTTLAMPGLPGGIQDDQVVGWVRHHVKALQPTPEEKRFDGIGWAKSIVDAERLARQHQRPVFLFTHDGQIATGRC